MYELAARSAISWAAILVGGAAVGLIAGHHSAQFLLPRFQTFFKCSSFFLSIVTSIP